MFPRQYGKTATERFMYQEDNGGRRAGGKLDGILLFREDSILGFYAKKSVLSTFEV